MEARTGVVIPLFGPRSCFECRYFDEVTHEDLGVQTYCPIYDEVIDSETYAAEDCPTYERAP